MDRGDYKLEKNIKRRLLEYMKDSFKYFIGFNLDRIPFVQDTMLCKTGKLKPYERQEYFENADELDDGIVQEPTNHFACVE